MRRGDLITIVLQGDYGKPRSALVIQSNLFAEHPSVVILPLTSELREAPLFRISVAPSEANGLHKPSQVMIDKPQAIPREKIGQAFGRIGDNGMRAIERALAVFLGFAD